MLPPRAVNSCPCLSSEEQNSLPFFINTPAQDSVHVVAPPPALGSNIEILCELSHKYVCYITPDHFCPCRIRKGPSEQFVDSLVSVRLSTPTIPFLSQDPLSMFSCPLDPHYLVVF